MIALGELPTDLLTARLREIRGEARALLVEFLHHLNELERRKAVLELGFPSLFAFCTDYLGLARSTSFRRITSARLLARFPIVADYLADGRLSSRTLAELRDVLDENRLIEILDRAAGRTEEQVRELVVELRPRPAPIDIFRKLPSENPTEVSSRREPVEDFQMLAATVPSRAGTAQPPLARLEPLAPDRYVLRVTVTDEFKTDLEAVREALSHKLPGAGIEAVLHECIRTRLEQCRRRRCGTGKKHTAKAPPAESRYIPTAVRNAVWNRDGGVCTFVGSTGHRCTARYRLEFHHGVPFAMGGATTVDNLTLRCRAHNAYAAEQDFGKKQIARAIARARSPRGVE